MTEIKFDARSINESIHALQADAILQAALAAVDPYEAVKHAACDAGSDSAAASLLIDPGKYNHIYLVGFGKAAFPMAQASEEILGNRLTAGAIITKYGHDLPAGHLKSLERTNVFTAGHPLPDRNGISGTQQIVNLVESAQEGDLVICLVSGGGSALLTWPVDGISLEDLQELTNALLRCGANINEINTLRKHLDRIKGGGLARSAAPAELLALVLSDVIGDPLDVIASGPTVPDPSTFSDCLAILEKYGLEGRKYLAVRDHLARGAAGGELENIKPDDPIFKRVRTVLIGSNSIAAQAAVDKARELGFHSRLLTTSLQGEARQVGARIAALAQQIASIGKPLPRPACLVLGGETTVTVRGDGKGGRNQEIALGAVEGLSGISSMILISFATDGGDGPTDAAGAAVTGDTLRRAAFVGLDPEDFLQRNDSYNFFDPLGDLLRTGPTQTNVNDLTILIAFSEDSAGTSGM